MNSLIALPLNANIYRAIRSKRWISDGIVSSAAFLLRSDKKEEKLSVLTEANCSAIFCETKLNTCFGEFVLSVESIHECELEVIQDPTKNLPFHASILGLPPNERITIAEAEFKAGQLAKKVKEIRYRPK